MVTQQPIRVLVVDDTTTYRRIVANLLDEMSGIKVVGSAPNGKIALDKIERLQPDLITLDLEMPVMDGLEMLFQLASCEIRPGVILISSFTDSNASVTMRALNLGAFDFVLKPSGSDPAENILELRDKLQSKLDAYARRELPKQREARRLSQPSDSLSDESVVEVPSEQSGYSPRIHSVAITTKKPDVIALGISTGGPAALTTMLPTLPSDLAVPLLIVQHMPPMFTKSLANDLDRHCELSVSEAKNGQRIHPGQVLIAPGGKHMKVVTTPDTVVIRLTEDPPEHSCRPSVDYLFRSVAHVFGPAALGVIMTGMGYDGSLGCRLMKRRGAKIIAQDEASCVVYGMPRKPVEEGIADIVAPLEKIGSHITRYVGREVARCV